jgi:hypothetical protein
MTLGYRVPGSGNAPSAASLHLRKTILTLLAKHPGMNCRSIRKELSKTMKLEKCIVKNTLYMLVASGKLYSEKINSRSSNYYVRKVVTPPSINKQRIKVVPSNQLPKLPGPVYQPMDWMMHQLQRDL